MTEENCTLDRIQGVWSRLGGENGVSDLLSGRTRVVPVFYKWTERDGMIEFTVTSRGVSAEEWRKCLEFDKFLYGTAGLHSSEFQATDGITYTIRVLKELPDKGLVTRTSVMEAAEKLDLTCPPIEVAYLIREKFSNEEIQVMGLSNIITMHSRSLDGGSYNDGQLGTGDSNGRSVATLFHYDPDAVIKRSWRYGHAFVLSQKTCS